MHFALTLFFSRYPDQAPLETFFELLKKKKTDKMLDLTEWGVHYTPF